MGKLEFSCKNYPLAIKYLTQSIKIRENGKAYYFRASSYFKLNQYKKSEKDFQQAIRLRPDYHPNYFYRGILFNKLGRYKEAIQDWEIHQKLVKKDMVVRMMIRMAKKKQREKKQRK